MAAGELKINSDCARPCFRRPSGVGFTSSLSNNSVAKIKAADRDSFPCEFQLLHQANQPLLLVHVKKSTLMHTLYQEANSSGFGGPHVGFGPPIVDLEPLVVLAG